MTHSLEYAVARIGGPSEDWLRAQLRARKLPGRKAGRSWRMTDSDIAEAIRLLAMPALVATAPPNPTGLSARSRTHLERARAQTQQTTNMVDGLTPTSRRHLLARMAKDG